MLQLRFSIDRDRCICAQNCVRAAPATFDIGDEDIVVILPPPHDVDHIVAEAIAACPVGAINFWERDEDWLGV